MENKRKGNLILIFILIIVIAFAIYAYSRFQNKNNPDQAINTIPIEEQIQADIEDGVLTCYGYGGVEKIGYINYEDAVNQMIKAYNESDGEAMASMMDFAANDVYMHKGLENFDENLYQLVTDAENYQDEYYNNSLIIMCSMLLANEENYIASLDEYKVNMELEDLSELKQVENSKFLYEATAKITIDDETEDEKFNSNTKITFISYDGGKSYYILRMDEATDTNEEAETNATTNTTETE